MVLSSYRDKPLGLSGLFFWLSSLITSVLISTSVSAEVDRVSSKIANTLLASYEAEQVFPTIKQLTETDKTLLQTNVDPYQIQKELVSRITQKTLIVGFKAGLTSKAGQEKFAVSEPLSGVLFKSGVLDTEKAITAGDYTRLMLETELGFSLNRVVTEPVESIDELKAITAYMMPIIELPNLAFADMSKVTGTDLIATNVASAGLIVGKALPLSDLITQSTNLDINQISVSLTRRSSADNQGPSQSLVNQGSGKDASGDQWRALLWLINNLVAQGYTIEPHHILITGALGQMIPAKSGDYSAQFGPLKPIEFSIR